MASAVSCVDPRIKTGHPAQSQAIYPGSRVEYLQNINNPKEWSVNSFLTYHWRLVFDVVTVN